MYQSDYIPMIEGNKRITINKLICNYSYSTNGVHAGSTSAKILLYGVNGDNEVLLHTFSLVTTAYYIANDYASNTSEDILYGGVDYDYLRIQVIKDDYNSFLGIEGNITSIITVTELNFEGNKTIIDVYSDELIIQILSPVIGEVVGNYY